MLLLIFAAFLSAGLRDLTDAAVILGIVVISGVLGFWQEHAASTAVAQLTSMIQATVSVMRSGQAVDVAVADLVPGDLVKLTAGALIPADAYVLEANHLFVDQAALTGETFPVEKTIGPSPSEASIAARTNAVYLGCHVTNGTGSVLVVRTGPSTELGSIAHALDQTAPTYRLRARVA